MDDRVDPGVHPAPSLVVFGLAGTTVSDDGAVMASFVDALTGTGLGPTEDQRRQLSATMGQPTIAVLRALLGDEDTAQRAQAAFDIAFARRVAAGEVTSIPGAFDTLGRLRRGGLMVCLITGFSVPTRDGLLRQLGWADRVDLVLSPNPQARGRPYPDMVLTAALRLQVDDMRSVVVVGDTTNDLLSGWRAGAGMVVGVLTGAHDRATLEQVPHSHILSSVAEIPHLLGLVAGHRS
jgi:phosphoglycolate phosphatase